MAPTRPKRHLHALLPLLLACPVLVAVPNPSFPLLPPPRPAAANEIDRAMIDLLDQNIEGATAAKQDQVGVLVLSRSARLCLAGLRQGGARLRAPADGQPA